MENTYFEEVYYGDETAAYNRVSDIMAEYDCGYEYLDDFIV